MKFCEQYPEVEDEKFPHCKDLGSIAKERVSAKLKSIRTNFKKAVDTGKRSGGGRIIFTFYELCERIWGGCPAVNSISQGIDTSTPKEKTQEVEPMQNELQNEEDDDERSSVQSNSLLSKYDETGIGSHQVVKKLEKPNPLKRKQLTVEKR